MTLAIRPGARRINKAIPVPYYYQIAEILRDMIAEAEVGPDTEVGLPSENELCALYEVTRATVRHALEVLEKEGLVYREKGRGTFLRRRRVQLDLARLCSTTEDMQARGWVPSTRLIGVEAITPLPHIGRQLGLGADEQVWEVHRLRCANGEPISLQWSYLPCRLVPDLARKDLTGSLYYTLRNAYGIELDTADQVIRTRTVSSEDGELLAIPGGAPVFAIERTSYDRAGRAVEYLHSLWRGDRYDLQIRLTA